MPKKEKNKQKGGLITSGVGDDEDTSSMTSEISDSLCHNSEDEGNTIDDDVYENKVKSAMDLATEKSVETRTNALISLRTAMQKRIISNFLMDNYHTLADITERSLKKGKGLEQVSAARLASMIVISLISTDAVEQVYKTLIPVLINVAQDPTLSVSARQEAVSALALISFLGTPESADLRTTLNVLHNIFCKALPKGNGELPSHSPSVVSFHTAALQGVCLLLSMMPISSVYSMASKLLEELKPMLKSKDLDMRIVIGEAFALVYECAREHRENFHWKGERELLEDLTDMMNESHKYVAKKDKKTQRSSFREIIQSIENGEPLSQSVMIGPSNFQQEFVLSSWALKFQYQALCHSLEQGLNLHMTYNAALRNIYDLGSPPNPDMLKNRVLRGPKKNNRQTPQAKARIMARNKNRDKRAAALSYED